MKCVRVCSMYYYIFMLQNPVCAGGRGIAYTDYNFDFTDNFLIFTSILYTQFVCSQKIGGGGGHRHDNPIFYMLILDSCEKKMGPSLPLPDATFLACTKYLYIFLINYLRGRQATSLKSDTSAITIVEEFVLKENQSAGSNRYWGIGQWDHKTSVLNILKKGGGINCAKNKDTMLMILTDDTSLKYC